MLKTYDFSRTRSALAAIRNVLSCCLCQDTAVSPVYLGRCPHLFCSACLAAHTGNLCPVDGCQVRATSRDILPHKTIHQITKNIFAIGELLCDEEIPERVRTSLSSPDSEPLEKENFALKQQTPTSSSRPAAKSRKRPLEPPAGPATEANGGNKAKRGEKSGSANSGQAKTKRGGNSRTPESGQAQRGASSSHRSPDTDPTTAVPSRVGASVVERNSLTGGGRPAVVAYKRNKMGETALHSATVKGDLERVVRLLGEGASPNTVDNAGWSPLHEAAGAGRIELVSVLLKAGASPNVHDTKELLSPLHDAASCGHLEVARLLVAHGADTTARNSLGQTPRDVAASLEVLAVLDNTPLEITSPPGINQSTLGQEELCVSRVVLACPRFSEQQYRQACQAATRLGIVKPARDISEKTTHCLLVQGGEGEEEGNSSSFLSCQLSGAEILWWDWLLQSDQLATLADTEPFKVDPSTITPEARVRSLESRRQPRLFAGLHFYLTGSFDLPHQAKPDLARFITLGGGKIVNREPDPEFIPAGEQTVPHHCQPASSLAATSHVILYQAGSRREPGIKYNMSHVKTLPTHWLLESINKYQLVDPASFNK